MTNQEQLLKHTGLPENKRDLDWEKNFLKLFPHGFISIIEDKTQVGPDSFPYLFAEISDKSSEPVPQVISWLSERGIGLAINPNQAYPDFVFPYGLIWNFRERGEFLTQNAIRAEAQVVLEEGTKIFAGAPDISYLPDYSRKIVKQFLQEQGVLQPRVLLMQTGNPSSLEFSQFDLCFSLESLGRPPRHEHDGILKALSWFFPAHYSLALIGEKGLPPFVDL